MKVANNSIAKLGSEIRGIAAGAGQVVDRICETLHRPSAVWRLRGRFEEMAGAIEREPVMRFMALRRDSPEKFFAKCADDNLCFETETLQDSLKCIREGFAHELYNNLSGARAGRGNEVAAILTENNRLANIVDDIQKGCALKFLGSMSAAGSPLQLELVKIKELLLDAQCLIDPGRDLLGPGHRENIYRY